MRTSINFLNLNIGYRALTFGYKPYGGILYKISASTEHSFKKVLKYISGFVLNQEK